VKESVSRKRKSNKIKSTRNKVNNKMKMKIKSMNKMIIKQAKINRKKKIKSKKMRCHLNQDLCHCLK